MVLAASTTRASYAVPTANDAMPGWRKCSGTMPLPRGIMPLPQQSTPGCGVSTGTCTSRPRVPVGRARPF